jgi:hypothetical protein
MTRGRPVDTRAGWFALCMVRGRTLGRRIMTTSALTLDYSRLNGFTLRIGVDLMIRQAEEEGFTLIHDREGTYTHRHTSGRHAALVCDGTRWLGLEWVPADREPALSILPTSREFWDALNAKWDAERAARPWIPLNRMTKRQRIKALNNWTQTVDHG